MQATGIEPFHPHVDEEHSSTSSHLMKPLNLCVAAAGVASSHPSVTRWCNFTGAGRCKFYIYRERGRGARWCKFTCHGNLHGLVAS